MDQLKVKLSAEIYDFLVGAKIKSLETLMAYSKTELAQVTNLNMQAVEEVFKNSAIIILTKKLIPATLLQHWQRISVGCSSIDSVTRGGISTAAISEIVGCSGVGKTQLCLQLALMTQLPQNLGGCAKSVVYLCTEDVFPIKRFIQLAKVFSEKYNSYIKICYEDNVFIEHIADFEQLKQCIYHNLPKLLTFKNVGLVVIDSIAGIFRTENQNITYSNRSQHLIWIATKLNKLSEKYGFAIVCTNQVADNVAVGATEPCLGLTWSNIITYRYNVNRLYNNQVREFEVVYAPDAPSNATCKFTISNSGIVTVQ